MILGICCSCWPFISQPVSPEAENLVALILTDVGLGSHGPVLRVDSSCPCAVESDVAACEELGGRPQTWC